MVRCLAETVQALPISWPQGDPDKTRAELERLLGLNATHTWADQAPWSDVERARPPLDEMIQRIHRATFLALVAPSGPFLPMFPSRRNVARRSIGRDARFRP